MVILKSNMRRAIYMCTDLSTNKVTIKPHPLQLTRLVIPYDKWTLAYLLDYIMAVNHGLLEEDGTF